MTSVHYASFSPHSVSDEFNHKYCSFSTALEAKLYSASDIMIKFVIDCTSRFGHGHFTAEVLKKILSRNGAFKVRTVGYTSLFKNFQFMPETSSVDVRPDVGIFRNEKLVCIFEEDSTKNVDFQRSVTKSCHYARALCRLKSINGGSQEGVCFIFPSALDEEVRNESMAVIQVSCQWDYTCCRFSTLAKQLHCVIWSCTLHLLSGNSHRLWLRSVVMQSICTNLVLLMGHHILDIATIISTHLLGP